MTSSGFVIREERQSQWPLERGDRAKESDDEDKVLPLPCGFELLSILFEEANERFPLSSRDELNET